MDTCQIISATILENSVVLPGPAHGSERNQSDGSWGSPWWHLQRFLPAWVLTGCLGQWSRGLESCASPSYTISLGVGLVLLFSWSSAHSTSTLLWVLRSDHTWILGPAEEAGAGLSLEGSSTLECEKSLIIPVKDFGFSTGCPLNFIFMSHSIQEGPSSA